MHKMKQSRFMNCNKKSTNSLTELSTRITFVLQNRSKVNVTYLIYVCYECNSYKPFSHMFECVFLYLDFKCSHGYTHSLALFLSICLFVAGFCWHFQRVCELESFLCHDIQPYKSIYIPSYLKHLERRLNVKKEK